MNMIRTIFSVLTCSLFGAACINESDEISYGGDPVEANRSCNELTLSPSKASPMRRRASFKVDPKRSGSTATTRPERDLSETHLQEELSSGLVAPIN